MIPTKIRYLVCMSAMYELVNSGIGCASIQTSESVVQHEMPTKSSGGPSSASSAVCSSPMRLKSQTFSRRSPDEDASIVSWWGDHPTCKISSWCDSNVCSLILKFLISHKATVYDWMVRRTIPAVKLGVYMRHSRIISYLICWARGQQEFIWRMKADAAHFKGVGSFNCINGLGTIFGSRVPTALANEYTIP